MAYIAHKIQKNGKAVWVVDVKRGKEGRRIRFFGSTKAEAEDKAAEKLGEVDEYGERAGKLTPEERAFIVQWVDVRGVTIEWMNEALTKALAGVRAPKLVADAINEYLSTPRETELSPRHLYDLRSRLGAFLAGFRGRTLESIRPGELETYIRSKKASAPNHYRVLRGLMNFAVRHEWIAESPIAKIVRPDVPPEEKEALTPDQMKNALKACVGAERAPMMRALIFGGFCGLRHSETMRLDCSQIDLDRGEVHVMKMKTRRSGVSERFVPMPPVARAWVEWLNLPKSGPLITVNENIMTEHRQHLIGKLELEEWPHNCLRRSFASYHLAAVQDAALSAEMLGHTDASTTKAKYRVARRKEIADAWFALTPAAVLESAESQATSEH